MTDTPFHQPGPIEGVLFDFHATLVDQGQAHHWVELAWRHAGRSGDPVAVLGRERADELAEWADRIWEHAREVDPHSSRDLDAASHRRVFETLVERIPALDPDLGHSLYEVMLETWIPYEDTLPVLRGLRERGIRTALISNVGVDVREVLTRGGMAGLIDAVVLSYEVGVVKPAAEIFAEALRLIDVPPARALMVGDSWKDDAGAAQLGVRTLILPRTSGPSHGLDLVLRLVG